VTGKQLSQTLSRSAALAVAAVSAFAAIPAAAAEFRSVAENAAVLYDAPSTKARKVYVASHGYPLEVVVVVEGWTKVRDAGGELTWIETKRLADRRTVLVRVPLAQVREAAGDGAPLVFEAGQDVLLDLLGVAGGGWMRVRHRDGQAGFVRAGQVWGS
jgi:SH3-like domain-containing protein